MMDIGTPCRETISFIYNLVRVSILSVALVGMKCADLESLVVSGKASSIPTIFSWGGSISPDGFLPSILLLLVIIVVVAIVVTVILVVVVVEGFSGTGSLFSGRVDLTGDEDLLLEDGDNVYGLCIQRRLTYLLGGVGGELCSCLALSYTGYKGARISSGRKKSQGLNSGDDGNTRDGGKTVGGAIGARGGGIGDSLLASLYACMVLNIWGSSWKGEMDSVAKRSLDRSSEVLEEVFPVRLGNSPVKPGYSQEYL
ncbi:hypothetical protein Tco_1029044 [Tanacetum coccineum]|uniref:Uncharacterized protein n=1 Tax=Tanacetum coccineum TaxID=301880 RepID=A0ABQ5G3V4_9ASTR